MNIRERLGFFDISRHMVEQNATAALAVMSRVIVIKCEFEYANDNFRYLAYSPDFGAVHEGAKIPEYWPVITECDGEFEVEFRTGFM